MKFLTIIAAGLLLSYAAFGQVQKAKYFGVNVVLESATDAYKPSLGVNYEQRFTKRSGIETDVLYRSYGMKIFSFTNQFTIFTSRLRESHLSIPVSYKLYTRFVDISAGPSIDIYLGWRNQSDQQTVRITNYSGINTFNVGVLAKVSKNFKLTKQFYLEPEVRLNPVLTTERTYFGFGFAGKYKL